MYTKIEKFIFGFEQIHFRISTYMVKCLDLRRISYIIQALTRFHTYVVQNKQFLFWMEGYYAWLGIIEAWCNLEDWFWFSS
jgi:hypothetical protein